MFFDSFSLLFLVFLVSSFIAIVEKNMPIYSSIPNTLSLRFLTTHSSTSQYAVTSFSQFFIRIKDEFLALFNTEHKFASLKNRTVAEFNLTMMIKDIVTFIKNTDLNNSSKKDSSNYVNYAFEYLSTQSKVKVNLYNIYHSGDLEPNELITQLINYIESADKVPSDQQKYIQLAKKGIEEIATMFTNVKPYIRDPKDDNDIVNKRTQRVASLECKIKIKNK